MLWEQGASGVGESFRLRNLQKEVVTMNLIYLKKLTVFAALLFVLGGCAVGVGVRGGYYHDHHPNYHRYHYHGYWR